jgi:hypothetical protein
MVAELAVWLALWSAGSVVDEGERREICENHYFNLGSARKCKICNPKVADNPQLNNNSRNYKMYRETSSALQLQHLH